MRGGCCRMTRSRAGPPGKSALDRPFAEPALSGAEGLRVTNVHEVER